MTFQGIPNGGLSQVCDKLTQQQNTDNAGWDKLIIKGPDGNYLRALSPNSGRVLDSTIFDGYYDSFVNDV